MPFDGTCSNEQQIPVTLTFSSASGGPATVDGPVKVTVQSGDGSAVAGPGPLQFTAKSGVDLADTVILMEADADLGAGVETIQDTYTLHVTGAKASAFGVVSGAPEPKV